jgi:hypothetical protein
MIERLLEQNLMGIKAANFDVQHMKLLYGYVVITNFTSLEKRVKCFLNLYIVLSVCRMLSAGFFNQIEERAIWLPGR